MSDEAWVVFRGQITTTGDRPDWFNDVEQVVEIVKASKLSKSYVKLVETPFYHPNVSYGDVIKVEPSKTCLDNKVAIIEFSGLVEEEIDQESVDGLGTQNVGITPQSLEQMMNVDKQAKPLIIDKFKEGLVYEPVMIVSHGTYKINVAFDAAEKNNLKSYFHTHDAVFHTAQHKGFGSVGFSSETKFEQAVKCLEDAPGVFGCFIAFDPREFPKIEFSTDLIPNNDEDEEESEDE